MQNYEILIKSFLRFDSLRKLINSILRFYPDVVIRIADDSKPENESSQISAPHRNIIARILKARDSFQQYIKQYSNVFFYRLPFDTGLSAGRNFLVEQVKAPYFVIMEDDFIVTKRTDFNKLYQAVSSEDNIVLVGGGVLDWGKTMKRPGEIAIENDKFIRIPYGDSAPKVKLSDVECIPCRFTSNFFMANTELFKRYDLWWEPNIKAGMEHALFFTSIPNELKIYFTRECIINHFPASNRLYVTYRKGRLKEQTEELKRACGKTVKWGGGPAKYK